MNTIDNYSNISFNARYLKINNPDKMPKKIYEALYKSDAIEDFVYPRKPKSLLRRLINLFRKDMALEVSYSTSADKPLESIGNKKPKTPYDKDCELLFSFGKDGKKPAKRKFVLRTTQEGIERKTGSIHKPGEDLFYKPPILSAQDEMVKKIEELEDIDSMLK